MLIGALLLTALLLWWWLSRPGAASDGGGVFRSSRLEQRRSQIRPWPRFAAAATVIAAKPRRASAVNDYAGTAGDWQSVCAAGHGRRAQLFSKRISRPMRLRRRRAFHRLLRTGNSRQPQRGMAHYQTPVYGLPPDLIRVDLGQFSAAIQGRTYFRAAGGPAPGALCQPRRDRCARRLPTAKILFWCDDPVALFFLQIQGSGRVRFDDGSIARASPMPAKMAGPIPPSAGC